MLFEFKPAVVAAQPARIMLTGPSGSGRTTTALRLAEGLAPGGKVALVDTQRGHSARYADRFRFEIMALTEFYTAQLFEAVALAADQRADVLIIDNASAFWSGPGGFSQQVDDLKATGKAAWAQIKKREHRAADYLATFDGHVILTVNVKTEWMRVADETGRPSPVRVGLEPDIKKNFDVDFHLVGQLDTARLTVEKSQVEGLPPGHAVEEPDHSIGEHIAAVLGKGIELPTWRTLRDRALEEDITVPTLMKIQEESQKRGLDHAAFLDDGSPIELTKWLANRLDELQARRDRP